ncbi:MAG TPA: DNA-directed RNA polymerase subunit omega [Clostridiales bacterium]|nr:MAG: hypothetical protein A2Y22_04130 [Clostridiales bacterium GWD2_32_59]HAN10470.1 DNA-directed RNA polymerase subunit omega [Clostridiales bacterium]
MLRPSYEDILEKMNEATGEEKFNSKYSVVIAVSKRAREIILENDTSTDKIVKPVSKAIKDVFTQKIVVRREATE